jgi:hypothetical protein
MVHIWAMEFFQFLLPFYLTGAELLSVAALYCAIRMHVSLGLFTVLALGTGMTCFLTLKVALEFSAKVGESSREFSQTPFLPEGSLFTKEYRMFLKSCKPLDLRVGDSFPITKDTFPTISQDIILGNLINLLVGF